VEVRKHGVSSHSGKQIYVSLINDLENYRLDLNRVSLSLPLV